MYHDTDLRNAVEAELSWDPSLAAIHIGVTTNAGIVTLMGHVGSFAEKYAAEKAVRRVKGTTAVVTEIEVRLPFDSHRTDEQIAEAVVNRLDWDVNIPRDTVHIEVDNGWITFSGQVEHHFQKRAAEQDVHRLYGVIGIVNHITIKQKPDASDISHGIAQAFQRSWLVDPGSVTVSAQNGEIRLTGSVDSLRNKYVASATAWAAPGVTNVVNDIAVV